MATAKPLYLTIADKITDDIRTGRLKPGDELPSTKQLAAQYRVSIGTAYRAIKELHIRDLVIGYQGKGVYVAEK
jgi:GntR family transcriptional regulator